MKSLALNSYAKLNLYLQVLNKRKDNYHNLKTVFERIGLCDRIFLKSRPDKKITLSCAGGFKIPKGRSNLVYRAARLLQENHGVSKGAHIRIVKRIPPAAGLGGGSSNAATTLIGLNKLWGLNLNRDRLISLAKKIGSDVPFFIYDIRFAFGRGRGDKLSPLPELNALRLWHVLAVPKIRVSTPFIYGKWDQNNKNFGLTRQGPDVRIFLQRLRRAKPLLSGDIMFNGLEGPSIKAYPAIGRLKEEFTRLGLKAILMSGSGPAVFALVSSKKEAGLMAARLKRMKKPWRVFVTGTV